MPAHVALGEPEHIPALCVRACCVLCVCYDSRQFVMTADGVPKAPWKGVQSCVFPNGPSSTLCYSVG